MLMTKEMKAFRWKLRVIRARWYFHGRYFMRNESRNKGIGDIWHLYKANVLDDSDLVLYLEEFIMRYPSKDDGWAERYKFTHQRPEETYRMNIGKQEREDE